MKKSIISGMLCLLVAGGIQAQEEVVNKNWNEFKFGIEGTTYHLSETEDVNGDMQQGDRDVNTISIGYRRGIALSQKKPIYLETGISMKWGFSKEEWDESYTNATGLVIKEETFTTFTFEVPVNVSYQIPLGEELKMIPYTGLYMRLHASGTIEGKSNRGNYESNIFDKDEMDPTFKRFQLGWQLGFDFQYRKFVLGWGYGIDFNKVWQNTRVNSLALNLGYRF